MNYKNHTLGVKTTLGMGMLLSVLAIMAWFSLHMIGTLHESFDTTASKTARKLVLAGLMNTAESDMAAGERGVILFTFAKDPERARQARALFEKSSSDLRSDLAEIRPLLMTQRGKEVAYDMDESLASWLSAYSEMQHLVDAGDPEGATHLLSAKITPLYIAFGDRCRELSQLADAVLQGDRGNAADQFSTAKWLLLLLIGAGAGIAGISFWMLRSAILSLRQIATEMLDGSRQVAAASGQVASASQSLAQGTSEQAATLEETSSSTTEITAITQKNADNTRSVAGHMSVTAQLVDGANRNLGEMVESMNEIRGSSEKISKIIRVIDEIAFQTNILALNAAVEAARAGEAGMGFAVVADEVRNLAQRSAQAAKDTASLIEESIGRSGEGGRKLDQVATSIQQITGSATQVKTLIDEIDVGSHEQARGIEQIATAVQQMEQVTQRSAANAEESAAASEELAAQAQSLYTIATRLRAVVGGDDQETPVHGMAEPPLPRSPAKTPKSLRRGVQARMSPKAQRTEFMPPVQDRDAFPLDESEGGFER